MENKDILDWEQYWKLRLETSNSKVKEFFKSCNMVVVCEEWEDDKETN